jgi:hypothetical protein
MLKTKGLHEGKRRLTITFNDMDSHQVSHYRSVSEDSDGNCTFEWENKNSKVGIYQIVCGVRAEALTSRVLRNNIPGGMQSFVISEAVHYGMQQQHDDHQHKDDDDDESEDDEDGGLADRDSDNEDEDGDDSEEDDMSWRGKMVEPEEIDVKALFADETKGSYGQDEDSSDDDELVARMARGTGGETRQEVISRTQTTLPTKSGRGKRKDYGVMQNGQRSSRSRK